MMYSRREAELHLTHCQLGGKPSTPRLARLASGYLATSSLTLWLKLHSLRFADFAGQLHLGFPCAGLTEITFITKKNPFNFQNITKKTLSRPALSCWRWQSWSWAWRASRGAPPPSWWSGCPGEGICLCQTVWANFKSIWRDATLPYFSVLLQLKDVFSSK